MPKSIFQGASEKRRSFCRCPSEPRPLTATYLLSLSIVHKLFPSLLLFFPLFKLQNGNLLRRMDLNTRLTLKKLLSCALKNEGHSFFFSLILCKFFFSFIILCCKIHTQRSIYCHAWYVLLFDFF